jgi:hypothetical protein
MNGPWFMDRAMPGVDAIALSFPATPAPWSRH